MMGISVIMLLGLIGVVACAIVAGIIVLLVSKK